MEILRKNNELLNFHRCNLCGRKVVFSSIDESLGSILREKGFPYSLDHFETLSLKSYQCPNCGSSDRDRLYKIFIDKHWKGKSNARVLDFAPAAQLEKYLKHLFKGYRTADLMINGVDDKVDITNMTLYDDETFDYFICSHVLEHVASDQKALSELYRVLKSGGQGILMTPIINMKGVQDEDPALENVDERWRRFAQDDHIRLYEKSVFKDRVQEAGFTIKEYGFWNLNIPSLLKNGITLKSRLYVVTKQK